ncbi:MAG: WD40/YVTN/BNR-like repeat-containing protein, partial [Thermoanaerobaculia bacterium]
DDGRSWSNPRCPEGYALQMKRSTPSHASEIITGQDVSWGNFKSSDHFVTFDHWNDPPNNAGNPFLLDTGKYIQYTQAPGSTATGIALTLDTGGTWNPVRIPASTTPFTIAASLVHFPQIVGPPASPRIWQAVSRPGSNPAGPNIGLIRIDLDVANRTATSAAAEGSGSGSLGSLGAYGPGQGSFTVPAVFGADPGDPQHVIATDVASGQMKVTQDGGATWTAMTALTDLILDGGRFRFSVPGGPLQVHTIGFNPDDTRQVLVGTEAAGIFESADGGQTWARIPFSDYFIRGISNFFFDRDGVVVATYGNGLWKLVPGSFPPPVLCPDFPSPCRIDVRTIVGERIYPRWACPHPPDLPTCQVYGLEKGIIEDLRLSEEGALKALAVNEGKLDAYDIDGERIDPSLPVEPTTATRPGEFSGCPGCLGILAEGGSITGFLYAEDRVTAVIGRFPDEQVGGKAGFDAAGPGGRGEPPANGALPYLQLVGTLKVTGQPTAATGDAVQVYGSGFCAAPRCSSVTLRIGNRVVAKSVKVDGKGSFQATVKVTEMPGQVRVSATQKTETGEVLRDERTLVVPILERDEE